MTNEELIAEIKTDRNKDDNLLQLFNQNKGIIFRWCKPIQNGKIELSDLMQESFIAMIEAVAQYDAEHEKASFLTFFRYHMLNHFRDIVHNTADISLPVNFTYLVRDYNRMRNSYIMSTGKEPSDRVYCDTLKISQAELSKVRKHLKDNIAVSLSSPVCMDDGSELSLLDIIADDRDDYEAVLDEVEQEELREVLDDMLDALSERQSKIIRMRYFDNMSLKECAEETGVTVSGVQTNIANALRQLRKPSENLKKLRTFVTDEEIYDFGMIRKGVASFQTSRESSTETAVFHLLEYREKLRKKMEHSLVDYAEIEKLWELHEEVVLHT